ncbi:hypothetical protein E2C01_053008 [Portunus trituberculatus]|uniref:Uncharacterized protein n=1 Tax=Portunus trituberculatus TaxID=210409 RepID=A0A5B7GN71_PORTR|nr:hypothetical protein [Portunus trituberculatus]
MAQGIWDFEVHPPRMMTGGTPAEDHHPAQLARTGGSGAHLFRPGGRVSCDLQSCQRQKRLMKKIER